MSLNRGAVRVVVPVTDFWPPLISYQPTYLTLKGLIPIGDGNASPTCPKNDARITRKTMMFTCLDMTPRSIAVLGAG